jgi:hypothetical protein
VTTPADLDMGYVELRIAQVLGRMHRAALAAGEPHEARAILDMAHSFADELADDDAGFDRMAFLRTVTEDPS